MERAVASRYFVGIFSFSQKTPHKYWSWFYIFLFAQTALIEKLQNHSIDADSYYFYKHIGMFNYPALNISVLCLSVLFVYHVCKGRILSAAAFFAGTAVFMGVYFSDNLFAFSLFFLAAVLILLLSSLYYVYYSRSRDRKIWGFPTAGHLPEAENKYPLKYSIALMYIDEYERLLKRFGRRKMLLLKKMFLKRINKTMPIFWCTTIRQMRLFWRL